MAARITVHADNFTPALLDDLSQEALAGLTAAELAIIQEIMAKEAMVLKIRQATLTAGLARRYGDTIKEAHRVKADDFGTVHVIDGEHDVEAVTPKKVEWDQEGLLAYLDTLPVEDARHLAEFKVSVSEKTYNAAMPAVQAKLAPLRTISPQTTRITVTEPEPKALAALVKKGWPRFQQAVRRVVSR